MKDDATAPQTAPPRKRMASEERRQEFLTKAIEFFAQEGFESSTRELARRLGVTQPLLYRYFPSKSDLISALAPIASIPLCPLEMLLWSSSEVRVIASLRTGHMQVQWFR